MQRIPRERPKAGFMLDSDIVEIVAVQETSKQSEAWIGAWSVVYMPSSDQVPHPRS